MMPLDTPTPTLPSVAARSPTSARAAVWSKAEMVSPFVTLIAAPCPTVALTLLSMNWSENPPWIATFEPEPAPAMTSV